FKVQTNSASAEYGAFGGGVVKLTLRSGTNEYHGALFEYMRNEALNAKDFFATSKSPFKTNQFGGVFGGPMIKNKAFFFGDYQGLRLRGGRPFTATVPTQAMREGRFLASEGFVNPIYDPASSADPTTRTQFANNVIPTNRFDPVAAKALSLWALPTTSKTSLSGRTSTSLTSAVIISSPNGAACSCVNRIRIARCVHSFPTRRSSLSVKSTPIRTITTRSSAIHIRSRRRCSTNS